MATPNPIDRFKAKLAASLADGDFVRLVLSRPASTDGSLQKVLARLVDLKGVPHLSLTLRHSTRDETKNIPIEGADEWLSGQVPVHFQSALLGTLKRDWQLHVGASGDMTLVAHKPAATAVPSRDHDRLRGAILDSSARDWLAGLKVVDGDGKVRASMGDKYAQINRYLEIFTHLAKDCGWIGDAGANTPKRDVVLADMGCGKGYLTFGLWHLFQRVWKHPALVMGIEARQDLVEITEGLSRKIGADGLSFRAGTIASATLPRIDGLIALHACDTATDDAIRRGVELDAQLIVVAPCCHQEVRPQMGMPEPLAPILEHGIMAERMAEWATDGLRALFLEWAGYRTKVFEFISSEHTPKNLMIAAIRSGPAFTSKAARERIARFKAFWGIAHHALDPLLVSADRLPSVPATPPVVTT